MDQKWGSSLYNSTSGQWMTLVQKTGLVALGTHGALTNDRSAETHPLYVGKMALTTFDQCNAASQQNNS